MSASSHRRSSTTTDTHVTSPLERAPKFSPPSTRNVSPIRRPLHERSSSQSNQFSGPTIRVVDNPGDDVYFKNPFPSQPSQILPPRNPPGYAFEHRRRRVSDRGTVANAVAKFEAGHTLVPAPLQHKKALRYSAASTSTSEADTLVASSFSPSSARFSQDSTPPSSPTPGSFVPEKELEVLEEVPSARQTASTIRAVSPSTASSAEAPSDNHALTPRASAVSLASTASADSSSHNEAAYKRASSDFSTSPTPFSGKVSQNPSASPTSKKKQASSSKIASLRPTSQASTQSLAFSDITSVSEQPTEPSPTLHEARTATLASGVRVQYPAIRAPSASSLWAESQELPTISSRMDSQPAQVHHWSSQLSTIHSESDRGSRSNERASQSLSARSQSQDDYGAYGASGRSHVPQRRETIESIPSSDQVSSGQNSSQGTQGTASSVAMPLPLFSPVTRPSQDEKDSDELHDTISPLQSPPLRTKRSGFLRRYDSDSSLQSKASSRPSSSQSDLSTFVSNTIPGWARAYYRKGERVSLGAPESSTESSAGSIRPPTSHGGRTNTPSDGMPLSIYRPRNRPHERFSQPETISISDDISDQDIYVVGPQRRLTEPMTPRLRQDRRSQAQLSAWKAPSFDENFGSMLFSRQNRQIVLFCLGFIFPFSWMIAAVLPLPPDPEAVQEPTASQMDLENRLARDFGPAEDKSFRKATWWRNLNRVMSGLGTLLIGAIIAIAILASRMS